MPPAPRPADARHSSPAGAPLAPDDAAADPTPDPVPAIRSIAFDGAPAFFAPAPLARAPITRTVLVRRYVSGARDPLGGRGVPQAFAAVDVDAWVTPALALVDCALSPRYADAANAQDDGRAPLARLIAAKQALADRMVERVTELVAGDGDATSAAAALRRVLEGGLSEGWRSTTVVQLPMAVDATFEDGGTHVLELAASVSSDGAPVDVVVAPGALGLDAPSGTLDLVLHVADPGRERRRSLDLVLDAVGPAPPPPSVGTEPRVGLGPWSTRVDVPVPLLALPAPPAAVAQTAEGSAASDAGPTLRDAVAWTFRATFRAPAADQDELDLRVAWGAASSAEPAAELPLAGDTPADPFVALAELTSNHAAIRADLDRLLPPDPDPDDAVVDDAEGPVVAATEEAATDRAAAISALSAISALIERLAATWRTVGPDVAVAESLHAHGGTATLRLGPELLPSPGGPSVVAAFVLRRAAGTWGPEDRRPRIGYERDDGELVVLDPEPAAPDADTLRYVCDPQHPPVPGEHRTVVLEYGDLSAVVTQAARAAARAIRNAALVPGTAPAPAFVLPTAEIGFSAAVAPALSADDPIAIGSGPGAGFTAALTSALATLLGEGSGDALPWVALTVGLSSRVGVDGPESVQPVLLVPPQEYVDTLPVQVGAGVADWLAQRRPELPAASSVTVELRLLPGASAAGAPLAVLRRLDYQLTS